MSHTPGPWVVYTPEDYDGPERLPGLGVDSQTTGDAVVWFALEPETGLKNDADAHLIAAAPDLLEALEDIIESVAQCTDDDGRPTYEVCQSDDFSAARAAIAKARGTS